MLAFSSVRLRVQFGSVIPPTYTVYEDECAWFAPVQHAVHVPLCSVLGIDLFSNVYHWQCINNVDNSTENSL